MRGQHDQYHGGLNAYSVDYFPYCGKDETPPEPCSENWLVSSHSTTQPVFFCPSDATNSFAETASLFSGGDAWVRTIFWPASEDGTRKYVRYMHNYDLRGAPFSIQGMESSYIWEQSLIEMPTRRSDVKGD